MKPTIKQLEKLGAIELPIQPDRRKHEGDYEEGYNNASNHIREEYANLEVDLSKVLDVEKVEKIIFKNNIIGLLSQEDVYKNQAQAIVTQANELVKGDV